MLRLPKRVYYMCMVVNKMLVNHSWHLPIRLEKAVPTLGFISYFTSRKSNEEPKNPIPELIAEADSLFENEHYLAAYDLLSAYKNQHNAEVQWRICRALYKVSRSDLYDKHTKHSMVLEAYNLIVEAYESGGKSADVCKWMAVLMDAKLKYENKFLKIEENLRVKEHLMDAFKLNPNDYTVLYMLGHWHFQLCTLSWFQKELVSYFYPTISKCSFEDALNFFIEADKLKPRYYLSNTYMLGKINYHMGNMFRAHYYLTIAAQMIPNTDEEEEYVRSAQNLIVKLKKYDVSDDAL